MTINGCSQFSPSSLCRSSSGSSLLYFTSWTRTTPVKSHFIRETRIFNISHVSRAWHWISGISLNLTDFHSQQHRIIITSALDCCPVWVRGCHVFALCGSLCLCSSFIITEQLLISRRTRPVYKMPRKCYIMQCMCCLLCVCSGRWGLLTDFNNRPHRFQSC